MLKCEKHPRYRAVIKPRADCTMCEDMWTVRQLIRFATSRGTITTGKQAQRLFHDILPE